MKVRKLLLQIIIACSLGLGHGCDEQALYLLSTRQFICQGLNTQQALTFA